MLVYEYRGETYRSTAPSGSAIITYDPGSPDQLNLANQQGGAGNSFTTPANVLTVTGGRVELLVDDAAIRGTFRFVIAATSGGVATGSALAVSPWYALDSLSTSFADVYFTLSSWSPSASTVYALLIEQYDNFGRVSGDPDLRIGHTAAGGYADGQRLTSTDVFPSQLSVDGGTTAAGDVFFEIYGTTSGGGGDDDDSIRFRDAMNRRRYSWGV